MYAILKSNKSITALDISLKYTNLLSDSLGRFKRCVEWTAAPKMDYVSLVCCVLAFLLYYNTLDAGFVYDDR